MNEINKLTCKFQNPEVEEKYLSFSWKSKSRSIKIGLYFILVIVGGSIGAEFLERTSNSNLAGFIFGFVGSFVLLKATDNFRRKYFERFFSIYLSFMVPLNSYLNADIYRLDYDLPAFPFFITPVLATFISSELSLGRNFRASSFFFSPIKRFIFFRAFLYLLFLALLTRDCLEILRILLIADFVFAICAGV